MDFNTFEAKYGYSAPQQTFKSGARAGIIIASVLSIVLSAVRLILLEHVNNLYYTNVFHPMTLLPIIAALLMIIAGIAAKPTSKVILAIPASLWAVMEVYSFIANTVQYMQLGFAPFEILRALLNSLPLYTLIVVLLMWLTCGGVIKNGTVCGAIIAVTSVLGCIISVIANLVQIGSMYYNELVQLISLGNIVAAIASMLFYVACAAALFMIGSKPKMPQFGYVPTAYQTQQPTDNNDSEVQ